MTSRRVTVDPGGTEAWLARLREEYAVGRLTLAALEEKVELAVAGVYPWGGGIVGGSGCIVAFPRDPGRRETA